MTMLPEIPELSEAEKAALDAVGEVMKKIGVSLIVAANREYNGGLSFIFTEIGGVNATVSGSDHESLARAFDRASVKRAEWIAKPQPIKSAVTAVNVIRERLCAGEDVETILSTINVA